MAMSAPEAARALERFRESSRAGKKIFWGPLYSAADLSGLARQKAATTHILPGLTIEYFQASTGQTGQGFQRGLRLNESNLDGAPGQLPAGYEFVGISLGVLWPTSIPPHIKDDLTRHSSLINKRHSHQWECGGTWAWPEGSFFPQATAASTTFASERMEYATNGKVGARRFPAGSELYFPASEVIKFRIILEEPITVTTDGLPFNGVFEDEGVGGNGINQTDGCLVYINMDGWRFEALTA